MSSNASHNLDDLESLLVTLQNTLGVVVPDEQRSSLIDRITPLLSTFQLDSLTSLAENLENSESDALKSMVLDVVSQPQLSWSLSTEIKDVLNNYIFSQLPENGRVWVVGCGQGQLAYAVVMEAVEYEHKDSKVKNLQFFASEVSSADIKYAESGTYNKQQMKGLSEEHKKLFMLSNDKTGNMQVKEKIRQKLSFSQCDLTHDLQSPGQMDLIICPEALVYFSNEMKANILQQCSDLLNSGGIFLTGNNQMLMPAVANLERVEHSSGVFYRKKN